MKIPGTRWVRGFIFLGWIGSLSTAIAADPPPKQVPTPSPASSQHRLTKREVRQLMARGYVIWVLTTESRIPKRYVVRISPSGKVTTADPLTIYFNNNRLQLLGADLIVRRQ